MITNAQKLQYTVDLNYKIDSLGLEGALKDRGLTPDAEYDVANKKLIDLAAADLIYALCSSSNVSEGAFKLTVADRNILMQKRNDILALYGISNGKRGNITSMNVW